MQPARPFRIVMTTKTKSHFHVMLNMADDDLDPYAYRLLGHYQRVCGANNTPCTETTRETAQRCQMSASKVVSVRRDLAEKGWITLLSTRHSITVTLRDRMAENITRYKPGCSPDEQQKTDCSPHEQDCSPHERLYINNHIEEPIEEQDSICASKNPASEDSSTDSAVSPGGDGRGTTPAQIKSKPRKTRPRDPLIDAIAEVSWGITPAQSMGKSVGARCGMIKSEILAIFPNAPPSPEEIRTASQWWRAKGLSVPRDPAKFIGMLSDYRERDNSNGRSGTRYRENNRRTPGAGRAAFGAASRPRRPLPVPTFRPPASRSDGVGKRLLGPGETEIGPPEPPAREPE